MLEQRDARTAIEPRWKPHARGTLFEEVASDGLGNDTTFGRNFVEVKVFHVMGDEQRPVTTFQCLPGSGVE